MHELLRVRNFLGDAACILSLLLLLLLLLLLGLLLLPLLPLMCFSGITCSVPPLVVVRVFPIGACGADLAVVALRVRPAAEFRQ